MKTDIRFFNKKMEMILPVFFGCMAALFLCVLISAHGLVLAFPKTGEAGGQNTGAAKMPGETSAEEIFSFFTSAAETGRDPAAELYQSAESRPWVVDFFTAVCGSREIAEAILSSAGAFDIPPALAFALCWEESRFKPLAVNSRNGDGSIDRGLFQLNSRSFPLLEQADFFNINLNAWHGMGHLRHCLDTGGSEISALAMYNAGTGKVRNQGAPKVTLDYVNRILQNRNKIEERFRIQHIRELFSADIAKAPSELGHFALLSPLRGSN